MKIIGLTGGIGSGKSTVSEIMADMGAVIIDADKVGHDLLKNTEVQREIISAFGKEVLTSDGNIDRKMLSRIVFDNPNLLAKLNRIMHPRMYNIVKNELKKYRNKNIKIVVLEAPLLIDAGWNSLVDEVWVINTPVNTVINRLRERTGMTGNEATIRIASQLSPDERLKAASVVIDNNGSLDELKKTVKSLCQRFETDNI